MERLNHWVNLRTADVHDIDNIAQFNSDMALETEGINLNKKDLRLGDAAVIADSNLGFYLISESEGIMIGQILITKEWSDWRNGSFWWIQSVFVETKYRRMGVYTEMYNMILEMAKKAHNVCGLRLYVDRDNVLAMQVYSHLGMVHSHYDLYEAEV